MKKIGLIVLLLMMPLMLAVTLIPPDYVELSELSAAVQEMLSGFLPESDVGDSVAAGIARDTTIQFRADTPESTAAGIARDVTKMNVSAFSDSFNGGLARDVLLLLRSDADDSVAAGIARDTTKLNRADFNDSTNVRYPTELQVSWTDAFADSVASNDALTIEIKKQTPLGTAGALYVKNDEGTAQRVNIVLDVQLPMELARLDSIGIVSWTEGTGTDDFAIITIYEDSTQVNFKGTSAAVSDTIRSAVSRTFLEQRLTSINITGGRVRIEIVIQTVQDSMFISEPRLYMTRL